MKIYPYNTPIIMTDDIFQKYGGEFGETSNEQRQFSFLMAEQAASEDIGTFLLPTTITGTFTYTPNLLLDYTHVQSVNKISFIDTLGAVYWSSSGTYNSYYRLRDDTYGIVDVDYIASICNCHTHGGVPYQLRVVYTAGLPTGSANQPNVLMAMTIYTQIILNEIAGYGNEGVGDVGITEFRNQQYSEKRMALINSAFGNSAKANFAHKLLDKIRVYTRVGI